jgi:hypothetical protein
MTAPAGSRWRQSSVVLRPVNMNMAGPINTTSTVSAAVWTDPNAKARGRLPLLVICHACRSCLGSSLCQAVFSNKSSHVFAGISESRRAQHCKSESENQSLHHRVKIRQLQAAGIVAVARNDRMTILDRSQASWRNQLSAPSARTAPSLTAAGIVPGRRHVASLSVRQFSKKLRDRPRIALRLPLLFPDRFPGRFDRRRADPHH